MESIIVFRDGRNIFLGPIRKEDIPFLTIWINDPETNQYLTVFTPMTEYEEEKWFTGLADRKPYDIILAIRLKETNEIIGNIGLHHISYKDGTATAGCFIGRKDLWSKGYGSEALMLLLEYAFNTLNMHKVCAEVYDFNPRSKRSLEKCGFMVEGLQKEHRYRNGRRVGCYMMAVFKRSFCPLWKKYKKEFVDKKASEKVAKQ